MILREFLYFDREQSRLSDDNRYLSHNDKSVLKQRDLRKTRLTLGMINDIRRATEAHDQERKEELTLIRKMYATPQEAAPA
jgi:hypothetical protein